MSKIAIITDQHFGVRGDNRRYYEHFRSFYEKVFFPTLKKHKIKTILDLGDTFDRRKSVNFETLAQAKEMYFDPIEDGGYKLISLVGNHTAHFKNTNRINTIGQLFSEYKSIQNIVDPSVIELDGIRILCLPWINQENNDDAMEAIKDIKCDLVVGHLELKGFEMYRGQVIHAGLSHKIFKHHDKVLTGHFHHPSNQDNVYYLGAPYEMTWSDYDDPRGFHIMDTETLELTHIENPHKMFIKIEYDDSEDVDIEDLSEYEYIKDKDVKIIVRNKDNATLFDQFVDGLMEIGPYKMTIIDQPIDLLDNDDIDLDEQAKDTSSIINEYIEELGLKKPKTFKKLMNDLYTEAMTEE